MNAGIIGEKILARKLELLILVSGLVLVGAGVFWWKTGGQADTKVEILGTNGEINAAKQSSEAVVDIAGAVNNPGIYSFVKEARIADVLDKAGGLAKDADSNWIEMYLNKSAKIVDGQKIYIPRIVTDNPQDTSTKIQTNTNNQITTNKININIASSGELDVLPGIGPVTANKIIGGRPYSTLEELREKKIVTQKVFDEIKDKISLW